MKAGKYAVEGGLDKAVGGRDVLIQIMEWAPRTAKMELVLNLLADPERAGMSMEQICKDAGISGKDMLNFFREASVSKALAEAHVALARKLGSVATDVADKAVDRAVLCPCTVNGKFPAIKDCPDCHGRGEVFYQSSLPHQQLVFETSGLIKKGGGVNVNVSQQVAVAGEGLFDRFVKATDHAAYGPKAIEGEVTRVEETESREDPAHA